MNRSLKTLLLTAAAAAAILFGFTAGSALTDAAPVPAGWPQSIAAAPAPSISPAAQKSYYEEKPGTPVPTISMPDFADIYERVAPTVVSITATKFNDQSKGQERFFQDPFHWFFGQPDKDTPQRPDEPRREESGGTGFLITPDGYILTNYHVIEGADVVRVRVTSGSQHDEYEGRIVGSDPPTDLALVKISSDQPLRYLNLGDSARLRVGEWVMAIGNPYFYEDTVTVGVVSAKGRRLTGLSRDASLDDYIQTDAAINVGNSGGPLLNLHGEVIGINSAVSRIGQGIGFAIPIDMAKTVLPQLRQNGRVARGAIGVSVADIGQLQLEQRDYFGLSDVNGALVQDVTKDHPADRAGIRPGDAIIAMDGEKLVGSADLISRISAHQPGDTVKVTILRDGRRETRDVKLGDREELWYPAAQRGGHEAEEGRPDMLSAIGVQVQELNAQARRLHNVPDEVNGVVITDVEVRSAAYEQGLRPGMVILEANRREVRTVDDYRRTVESLGKGDLVNLYLWSGNSRQFVTFRLGDE